MAKTKMKGDLGQAMITADVLKRGYKVAFPIGEDWNYDLIVLRNGKLERVQCKYAESFNETIEVHCRSANNWKIKKYTATEIDWIACYDKITDRCYYIPSSLLGEGRSYISLRISPPRNNMKKHIRYAQDFLDF
jgi:hypothetical protein